MNLMDKTDSCKMYGEFEKTSPGPSELSWRHAIWEIDFMNVCNNFFKTLFNLLSFYECATNLNFSQRLIRVLFCIKLFLGKRI
jgi:hypothetical protein